MIILELSEDNMVIVNYLNAIINFRHAGSVRVVGSDRGVVIRVALQ